MIFGLGKLSVLVFGRLLCIGTELEFGKVNGDIIFCVVCLERCCQPSNILALSSAVERYFKVPAINSILFIEQLGIQTRYSDYLI